MVELNLIIQMKPVQPPMIRHMFMAVWMKLPVTMTQMPIWMTAAVNMPQKTMTVKAIVLLKSTVRVNAAAAL